MARYLQRECDGALMMRAGNGDTVARDELHRRWKDNREVNRQYKLANPGCAL